jgi:hypothetical protein
MPVHFDRTFMQILYLLVPLVLFGLFLFLRRRGRRDTVLVDGSNVMHWRDNTPDIASVAEVLAELRRRGFRPGVVFDANAGWKLEGRYRDDAHFAHLLGLPEKHVLVVPKGQPADPTILSAAREMRARIVSNDHFRDWAEAHPEVRAPATLIRGGYRNGKLWLGLD